MKEITVTAYQCEHCEQVFLKEYAHDELRCKVNLETLHRQEQERREREERARKDALELARNDEALRLLVNAGLGEAALGRAAAIFDDYLFWFDGGCSIWYTSMYQAMVDAAIEKAEDQVK